MRSLNVISGGAAQGLVGCLQAEFEQQHQASIHGTFGAVGSMKDQLMAGADCDVIILTDALVREFMANGQAVPGSARPIGVVQTGLAVKSGDARPAVKTAEDLSAMLQAATAIYFPDPYKSTAGIHFLSVMQRLGLDEKLKDRFRDYPNGATAMAAMAKAEGTGFVGCTQMTEILFTPGVDWVAPLPQQFELGSIYTAAVTARANDRELAAQLVERMASTETSATRRTCGFA
ncbi:MAG: substrate-binding domain-containing protein [Pseudomonadota bacterium]